jgi:hypothetical protein
MYKRASELVKNWITPEEWDELLTKHKVPIRSKKHKGRTYVVSEDPSVHVRIYGKGKEIM